MPTTETAGAGGGRPGGLEEKVRAVFIPSDPFYQQMDRTSHQTRPWGKALSRRSLTHVTSDHFGIRNERRRRAAASVRLDASLYVSCISKQPRQICHFQLREPYACRGSKCSLLCFRGISILHRSCRSFDSREYSHLTDRLCKITMAKRWWHTNGC